MKHGVLKITQNHRFPCFDYEKPVNSQVPYYYTINIIIIYYTVRRKVSTIVLKKWPFNFLKKNKITRVKI